jgi:hypothetical protein
MILSVIMLNVVAQLSNSQTLLNIAGLVDYLQTEVSTSKQKKFPLVTFVDTPGLVDGDMIYPFDVNRALLWLGDLVKIKSKLYFFFVSDRQVFLA